MVTEYTAGPVERFGRRFKLEYVGMVSIYIIIGLFVFAGSPIWPQAFLGALGAQIFFLGLKKKTRDHLSGSLVLLAAAWLTRPAVIDGDWVVPFLLFSACICAMEGYVEKRQKQIFGLPAIFLIWGWFGLTWMPALLFVAVYLSHPWTEKPGLRRRLGWVFVGSAALPWIGFSRSFVDGFGDLASKVPARIPPSTAHLAGIAVLGLLVLAIMPLYWRRLILPHRIHPLLFAALAPWDVRLAAMFAMVGAIFLTATVFRLSIDSDRLRPLFKHAEWHYFWYVFIFAIWVVFGQ